MAIGMVHTGYFVLYSLGLHYFQGWQKQWGQDSKGRVFGKVENAMDRSSGIGIELYNKFKLAQINHYFLRTHHRQDAGLPTRGWRDVMALGSLKHPDSMCSTSLPKNMLTT